MANFEPEITKTLGSEGGYVKDPDDAGGETKFGISKRSYPNENIKDLTIDRAKVLYKRDYWDKVGGDDIIDQNMAGLLFDSAVNEGVSAAIKRAQKIVSIPQTGHLTTVLITKINLL